MLQQYYLCSLQNVVAEVAQTLDDDPVVTVRLLAATLGGGAFDRDYSSGSLKYESNEHGPT